MPRIFGLVPTPEALPFAVGWFHVGGPTVPNNNSATCTLGTYTMPFDGELHANFTTVYSWSGHQQGVVSLYSSTPQPGAFSWFTHIGLNDTGGTVRGQLPVHGCWSGLVKNQVVTVAMLFQAGGGGSNVAFEVASGYVRAVRVGL